MTEKNVKTQIKAHFINLRDLLSNISFLATFKLACDTNRLHERAALVAISFFVKNALASIWNSSISVGTNFPLAVVFLHSVESLKQKMLLWSFPEVIIYFFKKIAGVQTIAKTNFAILGYAQMASMTPMQCADALITKSCKFADVYSELTLKHIFIADVNTSFC